MPNGRFQKARLEICALQRVEGQPFIAHAPISALEILEGIAAREQIRFRKVDQIVKTQLVIPLSTGLLGKNA